MRKTNIERITLQAITLIITTIFLLVTSYFIMGCVQYWRATQNISQVEQLAEENTYWNGTSWVSGWTQERHQQYKEMLSEKEALIETSDIARWCYESAYTITGQIFRILNILLAVIAWFVAAIISLKIILDDIHFLIHRMRRNKS